MAKLEVATQVKNGKMTSVVGDTKPARPQIPKRIRKLINEAFHPGLDEENKEAFDSDKKEVLTYINGLLKRSAV